MSEESGFRAASLERFLAQRTDDAAEAVADAVSPESMDTSHLLAVATTTEGGIDELPGDIDWDTFLDRIADSEDEPRVLVRLIRHLGTRTATGIESSAGIRAIGDRAYELRHRHPHVFLTFLHEIHGLLRRDTSSEAVSAAESQFRRVARADERDSNERIEAFRDQDIRNRLVDPTVGTEARLSLLETLADESPADVPTELVLDLLYPLRNHHDARVERATLEVIESWTDHLPSRTGSEDVVESLEGYLAGEREELPRLLVMELVVVGYVGPAIIDWLTDLPRLDERQDVLAAAFRTLDSINGLHGYGDRLAEFVRETSLDPEPLHAGIDMLQGVLVGLQPYQHTEEPAQDDHMKRIFFTDDELSTDATVRETLREIASDPSYDDDIRTHAVRAWLSVRPPEIHDALWSIDPEAVGDDPVVDAKLKAAAEHRLIDFVDAAEDLWNAGSDDPDRLQPLVETLDDLPTHDIVRVLLDPAFDHDDHEFAESVKEVLIENGYEADVDREAQRRTVLDRIETRYGTMATATETDRQINDRKGETVAVEQERKRTRIESAEAASKSVDTLVSFRANGSTRMLQLVPVFETLQALAAKLEDLESEARSLGRSIESELEAARNLEHDIERVENDIRNTENDLDSAKRERQDAIDRRSKIQQEVIPDLRNTISEIESEIRRVKQKEPRKPRAPTEEQKAEFEKKYRAWQKELQRLENERNKHERALKKHQSEAEDLRDKKRRLERDIEEMERKLKDLRSTHDDLGRDLDESIGRIDEYETRLQELTRQLAEYREEYERAVRKSNEIIDEIASVRNEAVSEHSRLERRNAEARSELSTIRDHLRSLSSDQSEAIDRREQLLDRIRRLTERLGVDHDRLEDIGERATEETPEADETAYEAAKTARDRQYEENVSNWRLDSVLQRSMEVDVLEGEAPDLEERAATRTRGHADEA